MAVQHGNRGARLAVAVLLAGAAGVCAGEVALMPEPAFMRPEVSFPMRGATRTVLTPVEITEEGAASPMSKTDFEAAGISRNTLMAATWEQATVVLDRLEPEFRRDSKGVIEYAVLSGDRAAMTVLAPEFASRFADTLGPDPLVVIPSRFQVFVFPKLATTVADYLPMLHDAYKATAQPVSLEVFSVEDDGLRAVGVLELP